MAQMARTHRAVVRAVIVLQVRARTKKAARAVDARRQFAVIFLIIRLQSAVRGRNARRNAWAGREQTAPETLSFGGTIFVVQVTVVQTRIRMFLARRRVYTIAACKQQDQQLHLAVTTPRPASPFSPESTVRNIQQQLDGSTMSSAELAIAHKLLANPVAASMFVNNGVKGPEAVDNHSVKKISELQAKVLV